MRIRRNASKLLGSAIVYSSAPFPPPSDTWDPPSSSNPFICASSGELCELNQSPWDVYPNHHFFTSSFEDVESQSPPSLKEEQEEVPDAISENDKGILGKSPEKEIIESEAKPLQVCKRVNVKKSKEKKATTKKKKKIETTLKLCKKNDGKKWFCKRPAQLPHSFCEYHLSQSRSYYSTHKEKEASELESWCRSNSKKKDNDGGTSTNPYYYYNGFWPSSRKRKGVMNVNTGDDDAMHVEDEKKVDGCDASVVGGGEEDCTVAGEVISGSDEEEKKVCKKRRRKPTKCRSLKSLL